MACLAGLASPSLSSGRVECRDMDGVLSTGEVAAALGTTRSRVHRAVAAGLVSPARTSGGHLRFTADDLGVLEHRLGLVPRLGGLSREEVLVLAALVYRPFGLRSARAVARSARISPTTASRALGRLKGMGLVGRRLRRVVLGEVIDVEVWEVNLRHRRWRELRSALAGVVFPEPPVGGDGESCSPPVWLRHLFWNADVGKLDLKRDGAYIAGRVLASEDAQAHAWGAANLSAAAFRRAASIRGLEPRRVALARNLAAAEVVEWP